MPKADSLNLRCKTRESAVQTEGLEQLSDECPRVSTARRGYLRDSYVMQRKPWYWIGVCHTTARTAPTQAYGTILRNSASAPVMNAKVRLTGAATAEASTAPDGASHSPRCHREIQADRGGRGRKVAYAQTIDLTPAQPSNDNAVEPR